MRRLGDLEVEQDLAFERRAWAAQRIGWVAMTLVILAALAGLLGPGPMSSATAETPDGGLVVEYDRFLRASADTVLEVSFGRAAVHEGRIRLWVDRAYLDGADLERIVPEPAATEVAADRLVYVFPVTGEAPRGGVVFGLTPRKFGSRAGRLGVEGGPDVAFRQFVFP